MSVRSIKGLMTETVLSGGFENINLDGQASIVVKGNGSVVSESGKELDSFLDKTFHSSNNKLSWLKQRVLSSSSTEYVTLENGPMAVVSLPKVSDKPDVNMSYYKSARDSVGQAVPYFKKFNCSVVNLLLFDCNEDEIYGALSSLGVSTYSFKNVNSSNHNEITQALSFKCWSNNSELSNLLPEAKKLSTSVNLARYLVDLPANNLNPKTFCDFMKETFKNSNNVEIEEWNSDRLKEEKMGMLYSVGKAAEEPARLLKLRVRGKNSTGKTKTVCFVGKGITFDSGGLDVKPPRYMRNMKKDMGGAASIAGLAYWVSTQSLSFNCDFYFALAENAIAGNAMRPGDVLVSRNGKTTEVHNTDAEGRLAIGDALALASESNPEFLIDVATLTGAIKAGLGADVAGLFSNSIALSETLTEFSFKYGDPVWPMPMVQKYWGSMRSSVSDFANCTDGYGGAITASLFLQQFVECSKWAHIDIYAWADKPDGALRSKGGTGQAVQFLSAWLKDLKI